MTEERPAPVLIVGLGNPLRGDDGIGMRVAALLAQGELPPGVEVIEGGTPGLGLVPVLEGRRRVVLVDAADVGRGPGAFVRFTLDEARLVGDEKHISIHDAGLRDALLLAAALGELPDEVVIVGVQPANVDWHEGLSPEVEASLPEIVAATLAEARSASENNAEAHGARWL